MRLIVTVILIGLIGLFAALALPAPAHADVAAICGHYRQQWEAAKASKNQGTIDQARRAIPKGSCGNLKREANAFHLPKKTPPTIPKKPDTAQSQTSDKPANRKKPRVKNGDLLPVSVEESAERLFNRGVQFHQVNNYSAALPLFSEACLRDNHAPSCGYEAQYYRVDIPGIRNMSKASALYYKGCAYGSAFSCNWYAAMQRDEFKNNALARTYFKISCDYPQPELHMPDNRGFACNSYGWSLERDQNEGIDPVTARNYYKRSCDLGNFQGCNNLGHTLYYGTGGPIDQISGLDYWEKACRSGEQFACNSLDIRVMSWVNSRPEDNIKKYTEPSVIRFELDNLCYDGTSYSDKGRICYFLGFMLKNGLGGLRDEKVAQGPFQKSCSLKDAWGCFEFGLVWRNAVEISGHERYAKQNFDLACTYGLKDACEPPYR